MLFLLAVVVLAAFALYVIQPEERARLLERGLAAVRQAVDLAIPVIDQLRKRDAFDDALRARTRWPIVTLAIVAVNVGIFVAMLFGTGAIADPQTLVAWGGNLGTRTTNGEWWRLVTAMFVHTGFWHLVVSLIGLVQLGLLLERLAGHLAFAAVYLVAGVFGNLASLFVYPLGVSAGASGGIFGLYGLLVAWMIWEMLRRSSVTIMIKALKPMAPAAVIFMLYSALTSAGSGAELAGLLSGLVYGLLVASVLDERKPRGVRVATAMAAAIVVAAAVAFPLRGMTDARPEIARVIAFEDRTAHEYQAKVDQFKLGAMNAEALALLIDRTIVPELQAIRTRVSSLDRVPYEQRPLLVGAEEYLRLRGESWKLRAEGLHKSSISTLRKADDAEHESLQAYKTVKAATPTS